MGCLVSRLRVPECYGTAEQSLDWPFSPMRCLSRASGRVPSVWIPKDCSGLGRLRMLAVYGAISCYLVGGLGGFLVPRKSTTTNPRLEPWKRLIARDVRL